MAHKHKKKKRIIFLTILGVCLLLILPGFYSGLTVRYYTVETEEISQPVRIALITDLHSCRYGEKEEKLIRALEKEHPDLVLLVGDIFDDKIPDDNTACFLEKAGEKYPCFYVTGNHEYLSGDEAFYQKMLIVENCGIKRLAGEMVTVEINGQRINLCGINDPDAARIVSGPDVEMDNFSDQMLTVKELSQNGNYTILLSHRPEFFEAYVYQEFPLVVCGHAHGGQWRIPGILNGLFAPNQGFFPKYAGGEYTEGKTTMIVSRGLARESTRIPRFYNPPELVIIELR